MKRPSMNWAFAIVIVLSQIHMQTASDTSASVPGRTRISSNARVMRWIQTHGMPAAFIGSSPGPRGATDSDTVAVSTAMCTHYVRDHITSGSERKRTSPGFLWVALGLMFSCITGAPGPDLSGLLLSHQKSGAVPIAGRVQTTSAPERTFTAVGDEWKGLRGAVDIHPSLVTRTLPKELKLAALLSQHSYQDEDNIDVHPELVAFREAQAPGFPAFIDGNDEYDQQVYIWLNRLKRTVYVAIRGTQTYADVWHDLDARLVAIDAEHSAITGHAGIINKYNSIREEIELILFRNAAKFDTIVTTGHSLGGGVATIAAPLLGELLPTKTVQCITFGSPRVGGAEFYEFFHTYVDGNVRIINENDPVPNLPFWKPFRHVSDAYHITPDGGLVHVPDSPAGLQIFYGLMDLDAADFVGTHFLDIYLDRVKSIYNRVEQMFSRLVGTRDEPISESTTTTTLLPATSV